VVMVMVVVSLLVLRPWMVHVVDDQFGSVAHALHPRRRAARRLLASATARLMVMVVVVMVLAGVFRGRGRLVEVLPSLPVVPVQSAPALGPGRVQRGHGVGVGRRTVTVVFGTAVPAKTTDEREIRTNTMFSRAARALDTEEFRNPGSNVHVGRRSRRSHR